MGPELLPPEFVLEIYQTLLTWVSVFVLVTVCLLVVVFYVFVRYWNPLARDGEARSQSSHVDGPPVSPAAVSTA